VSFLILHGVKNNTIFYVTNSFAYHSDAINIFFSAIYTNRVKTVGFGTLLAKLFLQNFKKGEKIGVTQWVILSIMRLELPVVSVNV